MFIDEATFRVSSGRGGRGCIAFRREKFVPHGGPSGGDGGKGGDVIFVADHHRSTLLDLHRRQHIKADSGAHGSGSRKAGKGGGDAIIVVPRGTVVYDAESNALLGDLVEDGQRVVVAKGGRGGLGNSNFATPTRQSPDFAQPGESGESLLVRLELKLLADVGLLGLPSVGKSTIISHISNARPKIADYPFTTLVPNLGLVRWRDDQSFVVADMPGLIEGAHLGKGLGIRFLKHLQRVRVLVHVLEVREAEEAEHREPLHDYDVIRGELRAYNPHLEDLPEIVVLNKMDLPTTREHEPALRAHFEGLGRRFVAISAVTSEGLQELLDEMGQALGRSRGRIA